MSNKTISINPSLFSMGGSKTKKNRENKKNPTKVPLISPNVLKNKLLKRIKEHKQRETNNLEINDALNVKNNTGGGKFTTDILSYSDEFNDSINYLQNISNKKKVNDNKINYDRRKEQLERKTVRNYQTFNQPHVEQNVNIDLPQELMSNPLIVVNTNTITQDGQHINLHKKINDPIPYGILKGGIKPTYRDWNKTQRNYEITNPQAALTISGIEINRVKSERENRLNNLREKLKQKQVEEVNNKSEDIMITQNLIQQPLIQQPLIQQPLIQQHVIQPRSENVINQPVRHVIPVNISGGEEIIATKRITKKTIKRKYTLGRSKNKNRVSVLVKDRGTRKLILGAQKILKQKPINDVKEYLREHNFIKIGSNAPNDVLRKLFESSMLAGEITNINSEILLHNFSKEDKKL
jgi:hypothetical protein